MNNFGFLLIDKPEGITSFQVIAKLRKITGIRKIGHTGTLDPFATGLLPICIGKATRLASYLSTSKKSYIAQIKLGSKTDTGDNTGQVTDEKPVEEFSDAQLQRAVDAMLALEEQTPPAFSAIKVNGKRAYELARKGEEVKLQSRPVKIHSFEIISTELPFVTYESCVSKGTYIRVLSETFAEELDNLATTTTLRRTEIADLHIENAVTLEELNADNWQEYLLSPRNVLSIPELIISLAEADKFCHGIKIMTDAKLMEECLVISENDTVLGIASVSADGLLAPRMVFCT
jgi:tRNA pseudouridine55 synthase